MIKKKFKAGVIALLAAFTLGACNNDDEGMNSTESRNQTEMDSSEDLNTDSEEDMDMEGMNHSGSGGIPDCLKRQKIRLMK